MQQSLHIVRKDLRHLWPETLVGVLLLAAFAWSAPYKSTPSPFAVYAGLLDLFLHILIPVAWLVIIARLIHDEPLVGDRQFWTSRPYHWAKLLLAKLLYLVAFIYLPFLLMQVYLLKHAGLYPTTVIPALLHNLLLLTVIIIVPIAAIAAVTSTFARLLLSVLGGLIYIIVLVAIAGYLSFQRMLPPHINGIATAILILLPAISLVYQYATRRTGIARTMLIGAPILAVLLFFLTPATSLIRQGYPVATGPKLSPFAIPSNPAELAGKLRMGPRSTVQVALPFQVQGIDQDSDYAVRGIALTLDAPGTHWSSSYQTSLFGAGNISATPFTVLPVAIPLDVFQKIHSTPVDLHLSIAAEHLKSQSVSTWNSSSTPFDIPGHGRCSFSDDPDAPPTCRFPLEIPQFLFLTVPVAQDCATPGRKIEASQNLGGQPTTLNFDPVITVPLNPSTGNPRVHGQVCPGVPFHFVQDASQGNARLEVDDKQLLLDPLAARIAPQPAAQPGPIPNEQQ